jgi:hypothetical protein
VGRFLDHMGFGWWVSLSLITKSIAWLPKLFLDASWGPKAARVASNRALRTQPQPGRCPAPLEWNRGQPSRPLRIDDRFGELVGGP